MKEKLYDDVKHFLSKTKIPFFNYLFVFEIIFIIYLPNKKFNLLYWNDIDIGNILYNFGYYLYDHSINIILIILAFVGLLTWIYSKVWLPFLEHSTEYIDGTTRGFSLATVIRNTVQLLWEFIHKGWIIYIAIILASGQKDRLCYILTNSNVNSGDNDFSLYWMYMVINSIYLILTISYSLGSFTVPTTYIGTYIDINESCYFIIDQENEYAFIKNQILKSPIFYLVEKEDNVSNNYKIMADYKIIDYSSKFDEIKNEFEAKKANNKSLGSKF
ncbi:hypothetical protein [Lactobacillus helveticus]|uniref:hypothetical protein n=2 Tax=Lactobacillus helveticus TaxID=1587 RepID=UPI001561AE27|nr:hypothetical protein [Lactobacillus helveticus]NRO27213.1 hypothetical protein [Lactobacillus helveticus]